MGKCIFRHSVSILTGLLDLPTYRITEKKNRTDKLCTFTDTKNGGSTN